MSRLSAPSRNGTPDVAPRPSPRKPRSARDSSPVPRVRTWATVAAGVGIPCLSVGLSHTAGTLAAEGHYGLSALAAVLMSSVLAVSLSHLAWAVRDITRSPRWAAWALAVACDLVLVLTELTAVAAPESPARPALLAMFVGVGLASAGLNCWAFLMNPRKPR
jgi:hypothetical protein